MMDMLGAEIQASDLVLYSDGEEAHLQFGRVVKVNPKTLQVRQINELNVLYPFQKAAEVRKVWTQVVVIASELKHLDDVEVWLHYKAKWEGKS